MPALPVLTQPTDNEVKDMGGTFYFLEAKAKKVTARFADGMAIADRGLDGNIRTRSTDLAGNEVGKLSVDQVSAQRGGDAVRIERHAAVLRAGEA